MKPAAAVALCVCLLESAGPFSTWGNIKAPQSSPGSSPSSVRPVSLIQLGAMLRDEGASGMNTSLELAPTSLQGPAQATLPDESPQANPFQAKVDLLLQRTAAAETDALTTPEARRQAKVDAHIQSKRAARRFPVSNGALLETRKALEGLSMHELESMPVEQLEEFARGVMDQILRTRSIQGQGQAALPVFPVLERESAPAARIGLRPLSPLARFIQRRADAPRAPPIENAGPSLSPAAPKRSSLLLSLPFLTVGIISINFSLSWISDFGHPYLLEKWCLVPSDALSGDIFRMGRSALTLFTSMFLHEDYSHYMGNMIYLAAYGTALEWKLGRLRYLSLYLASGLMGRIAHILLFVAPDRSLLGSSGAIFGVMGACAVIYGDIYERLQPETRKSKLWKKLVWFCMVVWPILKILPNILQMLEEQLIRQPVSFIACLDHLGGFIMGMLLARWMLKSGRSRQDSAFPS